VEEKKTTVIPKVTASEKGNIKPKQRIQRDEGQKAKAQVLEQAIWNCSVGHSGQEQLTGEQGEIRQESRNREGEIPVGDLSYKKIWEWDQTAWGLRSGRKK